MNESVTGIIYKTTNLINGKIYVGQTTKNDLNYLGSGTWLKRSVSKNGASAFSRVTLEECNSAEELNEREIYWIASLSAQNPDIGYNIKAGGEQGGGGFELSEEAKRKLSEHFSNMVYINNDVAETRVNPEDVDEYLDKGWKLGRKYSPNEDTKQKHSKNSKGNIWVSNGSHDLFVKSCDVSKYTTEGYWLGRAWTPSIEEREARRKRMTGRIISDRERKLTSERNKGRIVSDETRRKLSESKKNSKAMVGKKNIKAKQINIYNQDDELVFECYGNFMKTICDNKLPQTLKTSLKNKTKLKNMSPLYKEYEGWYARYKEED